MGVLPKDVTKSQGYNEFTNAFFFFLTVPDVSFFHMFDYTVILS